MARSSLSVKNVLKFSLNGVKAKMLLIRFITAWYDEFEWRMEIQGQVLVYSILGCPHCMRSKNTLQEQGLPYVDVNLELYPHARHDLQMRTQRRTVPQIFFNARHIGGNDDLQQLVSHNSSTIPVTQTLLSQLLVIYVFEGHLIKLILSSSVCCVDILLSFIVTQTHVITWTIFLYVVYAVPEMGWNRLKISSNWGHV